MNLIDLVVIALLVFLLGCAIRRGMVWMRRACAMADLANVYRAQRDQLREQKRKEAA